MDDKLVLARGSWKYAAMGRMLRIMSAVAPSGGLSPPFGQTALSRHESYRHPSFQQKPTNQLLILVWRVITAAKRRLARMTVKLLSRLWHTRLNQQATTANCE
ncbi:hypothetical protein AB0J35_48610 [Nonomuraea angiospora]|uniref:hypothetical protein n=1 Tax=Nonomuraea angiospora TaxID=46172 RepID=UPI00341A4E62